MIYTIGVSISYDRYFEEQNRPQKAGADGTREGGSVWETVADAEAYLHGRGKVWPPSDAYSIYGVDADWESDTRAYEDGRSWHELLRDADLYRLDEQQEKGK